SNSSSVATRFATASACNRSDASPVQASRKRLSFNQGKTMKSGAWVAVWLLLLPPGRAWASEQPLVIENVTIVSPELSKPVGPRNVLIRAGRVEAVSDRAIPTPPATRRVNGAGKYLTPGIFDAHVHVSDAIGLPFGSADPAITA